MSEKTIKSPDHRKHTLRKVAAMATSALALSGGYVSSAEAADPLNKKSERPLAENLKNIRELPGYRMEVSSDKKINLLNSTVKILSRSKPASSESLVSTRGIPESEAWADWCTGVKIKLPGQKSSYVMTAGHCFSEATGSITGVFNDPSNPSARAENFISSTRKDFSIESRKNDNKPAALVDGISIYTGGSDMALLSTGVSDTEFKKLPSLKYIPAIQEPVPGQEVALFGMPMANAHKMVTGIGRYLGRAYLQDYYSGIATSIDFVGVEPEGPEADACNFGASGSMAILADGKTLGPLTLRSNGGYASGVMQEYDSKEYNDYLRPVLEGQLGIDMAEFHTLCGFSVADSNSYKDLLAGFSQFPTAAK